MVLDSVDWCTVAAPFTAPLDSDAMLEHAHRLAASVRRADHRRAAYTRAVDLLIVVLLTVDVLPAA
eukprot:6305854-Pyramimonas_sp.AAC.1